MGNIVLLIAYSSEQQSTYNITASAVWLWASHTAFERLLRNVSFSWC